MFRLLIVDDEEIITDALYDVFCQLMPEQLDVCKAYSGEEALDWLSRTRIDIVLTDISMPGLCGLKLVERIQDYWPRCKVIFLTGYNNFEYIYQAMQMNHVRYLLKTEGFEKVTETVKKVIKEIKQNHLDQYLVEQTKEQKLAYELMAQGDFMRHVLKKSKLICDSSLGLTNEFKQLNIRLNPMEDIYLVLAKVDYSPETTYTERSNMLYRVRLIWDHHLSKQLDSIGIVDRYGGIVWFIQPKRYNQDQINQLVKYMEGSLELIQEECSDSLDLKIHFTISTELSKWEDITQKYEKLRQSQLLKVGDDYREILKEYVEAEQDIKRGFNSNQKVELLTSHLEANREKEFFDEVKEVQSYAEDRNYSQQMEAYFSIALVLHSFINLNGLHKKITNAEKLLKMEEHSYMNEGYSYLNKVARDIFRLKRTENRDRAAVVIDRISNYIEEHLSEDLSLVRLAEIHFFNPSYLSHLFKQERGINLSEHIDKCRVRRAKELLQDGNLKIREVSKLVGYHTAHSFTRFFKKTTGMTPKEYREVLSQKL
ncbi:response regulator transcription factor [Alkalicoccobacillus porphyridii]|uniref:Response regulator n=1 Tax=Alkalicoccobacillus porphyridii TaxID=2597270 RepID=A0A554A2D8_9BACI|nr:response regulator [Alkalicoccobacillus porphyridii]TSB47857.1 response regulator [Alkalicoccobacillus porphyridii]